MNRWVADIDRRERERRKQRIFEAYLAWKTEQDIAALEGMPQRTVHDQIEELAYLDNCPKSLKVVAEFGEEDFPIPLYNVWTWTRKTTELDHPGNSGVGIVEWLLYLYTQPFDVVLDFFAGSGSTIDVCKKRLRRYWVSDRTPSPARQSEIRQWDITEGLPPFRKRWSDVALVYLDPPYWKQMYERCSKDPEDLANMDLEAFTATLAGLIRSCAEKLRPGAHIAMLMQPTQWHAPEHQFTDHVIQIINAVGNKTLTVENRISCPYSTERCTPHMVEWAKANKKVLVLSRELVIWERL